MIDIHTHILPGIDDGAPDWEHAILLARTAVEEGITDLIATPHHHDRKYWNEAPEVIELTEQLNERLRELSIPLTVHTGQEIHIHNELLTNWQAGKLLALAGSPYVLLEMPSSHIPKSMEQLLYELNLMGIKSVIAHPERNAEVVSNPNRLDELIGMGAYAQVTSHSLNGGFGRGIERAAWTLCRRGLIHFVASDAHNLAWRGFGMQQAYKKVTAELGPEWSAYYQENARLLLRGRSLAEPLGIENRHQTGGWSSKLNWRSLFRR